MTISFKCSGALLEQQRAPARSWSTQLQEEDVLPISMQLALPVPVGHDSVLVNEALGQTQRGFALLRCKGGPRRAQQRGSHHCSTKGIRGAASQRGSALLCRNEDARRCAAKGIRVARRATARRVRAGRLARARGIRPSLSMSERPVPCSL